MELLRCNSLHPSTGVLVKAVAIRLLPSVSQAMSHEILVSFEEAAFLGAPAASQGLTTFEVLQLLQCLILYEENRKVLILWNFCRP